METYAIVPSALKELGLACIGVYFALADRANEKGQCWPSHRRIADDLQIGVTKVKEALLQLRDAGWVTWETRKYEGGLKSSNIYTIRRVSSVSTDSRIAANDSRIPAHDGRSAAHDSRIPATSLGAMRRTDSRIPAIELVPNELLPRGTNSSSLADASDAAPDLFAEFWTAYPRKVGKAAARKAWAKAVTRTDPAAIIAATASLAADPNLPDTEFIPHPSTWLNRDGWHDEPYPARSNGTKAPSGAAMFVSLANTLMEVEA